MGIIDTSNIDATKPDDSDLQTQDLRDNFSAINTAFDAVNTRTATNKAAAVLLTPVANAMLFVGGTDGGWFKGVTGAAPGTYTDNGGAYCGTVFIPTGGNGSKAYLRVDDRCFNVVYFGATLDGVDSHASIVLAEAAWNAQAGTEGGQYPAATTKPLYFPSGHIASAAGRVIEPDGTGLVIMGDGLSSRLDKIDVTMTQYRCEIKNLLLTGASVTGLDIRDDSGGALNHRYGKVSRVHIRDKTGQGFRTQGNNAHVILTDVHLEKNEVNARIDATLGLQMTNVNMANSVSHGCRILGGTGEIKGSNVTVIDSGGYGLYIQGDNTNAAVESYFHQWTVTRSGAANATAWSITGVTDAGGGEITIAITGVHELVAGTAVTLSGTTDYNAAYTVVSVGSTGAFNVTATYVSSQTGTATHNGWDLYISTQTDNTADVNDMYFMGGNINYARIEGAYNVMFMGTRIKNQLYLRDINRVLRIGSGRGRDGNVTQNDIPISGEVSGFAEIISIDDGGSFAAGSGGLVMRVPDKSAALVGNVATSFNEVKLLEDTLSITSEGLTHTFDSGGMQPAVLYSGTSGVIADTGVYSFTPPFGSGLLVITNGAGQNARMAQIGYETTTPATSDAGFIGSVMAITTGALTGVLGGTSITISAHTDGKLYIENNTGGDQTMYWTLYR